MIIDIHAHVTAPDSLYVYKSAILSHRGGHGRGAVGATDEEILKALNAPVFGGSSHLDQLKEAGTDMQIISPRPYQMMHSESAKLVQWYTEETNAIIARQVKLLPQTFRGVCGLPQSPTTTPSNAPPIWRSASRNRALSGVCSIPIPVNAPPFRPHRSAIATGIPSTRSWSNSTLWVTFTRPDAGPNG